MHDPGWRQGILETLARRAMSSSRLMPSLRSQTGNVLALHSIKCRDAMYDATAVCGSVESFLKRGTAESHRFPSNTCSG